jgi:hypothetical protein
MLALLSPLASFARWDDYRGNNRNDEAYNVCAGMTFGSDTNACMDVVRGRYFQSDALRTCAQQTFASDQISCMKQIADNDYEPAAVQVCQGLTFSSDTNSCMKVIANQAFDHAALRVCAGMTFSSDIIGCLSRSGYQPRRRDNRDGYRDGYNRQTTTQDILVDALDQILRDMLGGYARSQGRICSVVNSNDTYLGDVSENQLVDAGRDFARSQGSCVVTNVKGATRSRTLIGANGAVIADRLTEKEVTSLKRRAGYSSCRVMTCEMR